MLKISYIFKQYLILWSSLASFGLGVATMAYLQPKAAFDEAVADAAIANPFSDELVSRALPKAQEDPLNIHFELTQIEPEKKAQITSEKADKILSDFQNRISSEFAVPELIFNQTKFWFRIYTEFDSNKKIIHDSLHPHIIYDIIDISNILSLPANAQWLNVVKAEKVVRKRVVEIRMKLRKMAKKKEEQMDAEELGWLAEFKQIEGNQSRIIHLAAQNLRIQTGQKDFFENGLSVSGRYIEGMEKIFRDKKLPLELTRLPFVESSFAIGATSKVGAAGIWQFMPGIGRQFMTVNNQFDERRNPWKASEAAAKLLKENYTILHKNWGLALTAYNHGPGGVRLAMQKTGTRDIAKIVRTYRSRSFDFASANFYTCFLAAMHAQMYNDIIWNDRVTEPTLNFEIQRLKKSVRASALVSNSGLSAEQILMYNPELDRSFKSNGIIPKGYKIYYPVIEKTAVQNTIAQEN